MADSVVSATVAVPTVDDARRAADVLAAAGAGRVLLFGSVSRGAATEHSDIDLVAIYDDIDYDTRSSITTQLQVTASAAAGFPVAVIVTDRPEWEMRTTRVRTSLEALVGERGMVLFDRGPGRVNWDKEMVMPTDDYQQGLYRLGRVNEGLVKLANALEPGKMELLFAGLGDVENAALARIGRMLTLGGAGQTVVEQSVKSLVHVTGRRTRDLKGHHIERLTALLDSLPERTHVEGLLTPPGPVAITPWHWWERYHRPGTDPDPAPSQVIPVIRAACRVATYTTSHFGTDTPTAAVRATTTVVEHYVDTHDLLSGHRLQERSPDPPGLTL